MADPWKYKTSAGGAWQSVPQHARQGTATQAACVVVWPRPTAMTPSGRPCGAVGKPQIVIRSNAMSGQGVGWWDALLGGAQSVQFWMSAFNPRTNGWESYTGYLQRPQVGGDGAITTDNKTVYTEVLILLTECVAA